MSHQVRDAAWWSASLATLALAVGAAAVAGWAVFLFGDFPLPEIGYRAALSLLPAVAAAGLAGTLLLLEGRGRLRDARRSSAVALGLHGIGLAGTGAALSWSEDANGAAATEVVVAWAVAVILAGAVCAWRTRSRWPLTALLWASPLAVLLLLLATMTSLLVVTGPSAGLAAALCAWHARRARAGWDVLA